MKNNIKIILNNEIYMAMDNNHSKDIDDCNICGLWKFCVSVNRKSMPCISLGCEYFVKLIPEKYDNDDR